MVMGRTRSSVSRISRREAADDAVVDPVGNGDAFGGFELGDGLLLLIEVAGELDLGFDGASFVAQLSAARRRRLLRYGRVRQAADRPARLSRERSENRRDADFRTLEKLGPGLAGNGAEFAQPDGWRASAVSTLRVVRRCSKRGHARLLLLRTRPRLHR